ncbi:MAG TPA: dynamin family protein [Gammaproteobacteria bacterium]|nr:dynamin family protein [Gammaproteobacteria bacterium]
MTAGTKASLDEQINRLMAHLEQEHPQLLGIVQTFRELDKVAYRLGLLDRTESYATQVSWWPLIAVLGTFSSGKSTFINNVLGRRLQATGNQAVDDKFTVICYGRDSTPRILPGLALDSDPRFPLYRIGNEIDAELKGDSQRLDTYLQLKTSDSEELRGRIFIDSPGFDADEQRTATLRITSQIIDISDLVLVFFDARHPEPGAMRDTLEHLVAGTLKRGDFNKFLYVLNQIDNAAREDNPEEVFAAWQRALAQKGLTAGRFYQIYDPASAAPIENEHLRRRFEAKRERDMSEILGRIRQLEVERSYRVAGRLEQTAVAIREMIVPRLIAARRTWKRRVLWLDAIVFGGLAVLAAVLAAINGVFSDGGAIAGWFRENPVAGWLAVAAVVVAAWLVHRLLRRIAARSVQRQIERDAALGAHAPTVARAFERNARSWWPFLAARPAGWTRGARKRLDRALSSAHAAVQELNDLYADPSGRRRADGESLPPAAVEPAVTETHAAERTPSFAADAPDGPEAGTDEADADSDTDKTVLPPRRDGHGITASHGSYH